MPDETLAVVNAHGIYVVPRAHGYLGKPLMADVPLHVKGRNDPLVVIWITKLNPDKTQSPYDFAGATVEFYQKDDAYSADSNPATYVSPDDITIETGAPWDSKGIPIADSTARNRLSIQMSAANLIPPLIKYYRIDAVKAGKRATVLQGLLVIESA